MRFADLAAVLGTRSNAPAPFSARRDANNFKVHASRCSSCGSCATLFRMAPLRGFGFVILLTIADGRLCYREAEPTLESLMAAISKALSRISGTDVDIETLKTIIMFCVVGLTVLLMCMSYGLDLSAGFF